MTGKDNSDSILSAVSQYDKIDDFLADEELKIPIHCTSAEYDSVYYTYDIDGVVIELMEMCGVVGRVHYLFLPELQGDMISNHYNILKKHIKLSMYSEKEISALRNSCGWTIGHVDGGYFLNMSVVPSKDGGLNSMFLNNLTAQAKTAEVLNQVVCEFKALLCDMVPRNMDRPSMQKAKFYDLSKFNVVAGDQGFVLMLLQKSIRKVSDSMQVKIMLTLSQFGQKMDDIIDYSGIVDVQYIKCVSLHTACNIHAKDPRVHLMWSRYGIEEVVGNRGSVFSTLCMNEAANFSSNLDHREIDITRTLRGVFKEAELGYSLNFVQLYCNTPHSRMSKVFMHPVSGCIVNCGLCHPRFLKVMTARAKNYLRHMSDLCLKFGPTVRARIEQVALFEHDLHHAMDSESTFDEHALSNLLMNKPLLVPFTDVKCTGGVMSVVQDVARHMVEKLRCLLESNNGKGGYDATWAAYQCELGLEEIFFGHPFSTRDFKYSVSLGTSSTNVKSLTCFRGFAAFAPASSASAGISPPPLIHWTSNDKQQERITRVFRFSDSVTAGLSVVGAELVMVLLCDLYDRNDRIPVLSLQQPRCPGTLKGFMSVQGLCETLATEAAFVYPHTFCRAKQIVAEAGQDVLSCLKAGFEECKLHYFPALRYWSDKGNKKVSWNFKDFWEIHSNSEMPSIEAQAMSLVGDVCLDMERRGLCFGRNTQKYMDHGMPWVKPVLGRLPKSLDHDDLVKVMTFVSCIGMIQNGEFISFDQLRVLVEEIPVTQARLRSLQVLSRFLLPKVNMLKLWALHESIPYKVKITAAAAVRVKKTVEKRDSPERVCEEVDEAVMDIDCPTEVQNVKKLLPRFLPANCSLLWSSLELSFIDVDPELRPKDAYKKYVKECERLMVAVRSYRAFYQKRQKMLQ